MDVDVLSYLHQLAFPVKTVYGSQVVSSVPNVFHDVWKRAHTEKSNTLEAYNAWVKSLPPAGCNCNYDEALKAVPVRLDDWFAWSVDLHNWVNRKLRKPIVGHLDAFAKWNNIAGDYVQLLIPEILCPLPDPVNRTALIVVAPDAKTQSEFAITGKRMREYAINHSMDFVLVSDITRQTHLCGNKYAYAQVAARYEQSLWLDTDIVVDPSSPNVVEEVPIGSWGLVDDMPFMDVTAWHATEWFEMQRDLEVPRIEITRVWNSGVVVAPKNSYRWYYPPPGRVKNVWCAEQHWHTYCLLKDASVIDLDSKWNNGYPWEQWETQVDASYFNHANGCFPHSKRLEVLQALNESTTPKGGW